MRKRGGVRGRQRNEVDRRKEGGISGGKDRKKRERGQVSKFPIYSLYCTIQNLKSPF